MRLYRPAVRSGNCEVEDYTWWVYSEELDMFVPLLMNKVPVLKELEYD